MQLGSVYLYPNILDVFTDLDSWTHERNRTVYQRNLKIYRGSDNKIEFRVKSSDQKAKNISGRYFVFSVVARESQERVLLKDCKVTDPNSGRMFLYLTRNDLQLLDQGYYQYSLYSEHRKYIDSENYTVVERLPVYTDTQYGANSVLEVHGDGQGEPQPSYVVKEFKFYSEIRHKVDYWVSGIIPAMSQTVQPDSLHTFQAILDDYSGTLTLEGSLDEGGNPQTWVDIESREYLNSDEDYYNVTGKYNFFRFKLIPKKSGTYGEFRVTQSLFLYYDVEILSGGTSYNIGDQIRIKGNKLGGEQVTNDLIITVLDADSTGRITLISWEGVSYNGTNSYVVNGVNSPSGFIDKIIYRH